MSFHALERYERLHDGYRKVFAVAGRRILLLQHQGEQFAIDNICPHAGYPMEEGRILDQDIRCPMHGYRFDLQTGECTFWTEGPCRAIETFSLVRRGDEIGIEL